MNKTLKDGFKRTKRTGRKKYKPIVVVWGDGSVDEVLSAQAGEPEFRPSAPMSRAWYDTHTYNSRHLGGGRNGRILGACWPANLAILVSSKFSVRLYLLH